MSFYNMLFGQNPMSNVLLATLGLTKEDCGRFRDCGIANGEIYIYTRNGGGNRGDYQDVFDSLSTHSNYLRDADDDFDYTYATIYFSFPSEYADDLAKINNEEEFNPSQRWLDMIASISNKKENSNA